jgi:hypothetical protein
MMKKHVMMAAILILLAGLSGCCTLVPGKIVYSDDLKGTIEELKERGLDIKVAVMVSDTGQLLFYDIIGERLKECVLPKPSAQSKTDKKQDSSAAMPEGVCRGLTTGSAVTVLKTLPVIKSNSGNCITLGPDATGMAYEYCW